MGAITIDERAAKTADWASAVLAQEGHGGKVAKIAQLSIDLCAGDGACPRYFAALSQALEKEPPPFDTAAYDHLYRQSAIDARWIATSLLTNSGMEGDGSRRLWSLAACSSDRNIRQRLKRHAVDESRHALMYLAMVDFVFPGAVEADFALELRQLSPGFTMRKALYPVPGSPYARPPTLDDFVQMNIAEIRTTIHHMMQRKALSLHCPVDSLPALKWVQDCLLNDELSHVGYTAVIIEELISEAEDYRIQALFTRRLRDFNFITTEELGDNAFGCSSGCCAKHEWCIAKPAESPLQRFNA